MSIDYGTDRLFVTIKQCPACGGAHIEIEFKRLSQPDDAGHTHRGRCLKAKQWIFWKED